MLKRTQPPRWAARLLEWFCADEWLEEIQGDLEERFLRNVDLFGERSAKRQYVAQVFGFVRRFAWRDKKSSTPLQMKMMISNYFKIAWRNLVRSKSFSAINISGLALGMAAAILIFLWIEDEKSIGTHYKNTSDLYRIMEREFTDGKIVADEDTPGLLADELKRQFPEIIYAAGLSSSESHVLTAGNKTTRQRGNFAGEDWLKMYEIPLLAGTYSALKSPGSIAVSRKLAETYFSDPEKAFGQAIRFGNGKDYQITAVYEDLPAQAPDKYEFLLNWDDYLSREKWLKEWTNFGPGTRILLRSDADPKQVNARLKWFLKGLNKDFSSGYFVNLFLMAEKDAYLHSNFKDGYPDGGRIDYVRLLAIIAVFLLLIATINFMNLATARSVKRAREVGVRKVVGADRGLLIGQFIGEAVLLTAMATVVAIALVYFILPFFNQLTDKQLFLPFGKPVFWFYMAGLLIFTGLLAGSYPAFFLSSLNPVKILKGTLRFGSGAKLFRRGLVVFQFVLSMLLIVGTAVVYRQLQYLQTKNLGYNRENLISIPLEGELSSKYDIFKEDLLSQSGIQSVTFMHTSPLNNGNTTEGVSWPGKSPEAVISFHNTATGYDFAKTMKVKFKDGRDFNKAFATDSSSYIINETAAKKIGYKNPVGQPLTFWDKPGKIVGLVEDFHFNSLHDPIRPLIIRLAEWKAGSILVRTEPGQTKEALSGLEAVYKKINPRFPFTYSFVDEGYQKLYKSESTVGVLATIFAGLAIFIACLGLFGLAAFTAEQRIKEIGVRKVLGASVSGIVAMLSQDFLRLVVVAILIASPLAWYVMSRWLENFAYKVDMSWLVFVLSGLLVAFIGLLTISYQSIKAALMNPVKSLKSE